MVNTVFFYVAAALCVCLPIAGFVTQDKKKRMKSDGKLSRRAYVLWAVLAVVIALAVRGYAFGSVPGGMNQDGAMGAVEANALAQHGTDRFGMSWPLHFTAWGYGQMSVLLSYATIPFIKALGLSVVSARLPMLVASLVGIALVYLYARAIFGRRAALIALFLAAINPWQIMQSRWALDCNLFPHVLLAGVYVLTLGVERRGFLYIAMVFFGLAMYCYGIAIFAVPLLLLAICVFLLATRRIKLREALICLGVYALIAWPIYAMSLINALSLPSLRVGPFTIPYFPDSMRVNDILFFAQDKVAQLYANAHSLLDVVILQKPLWAHNAIPAYGTIYLFAMPFAALGLVTLCFGLTPRKEADAAARAGRFALLAWLIVGLLVALVFNGININRVNLIFYPLILLCALGVNALMDCAWPRATAAIVAVLYGVSFAGFTAQYFTDHAAIMARENATGYGDALAFAERQNPKTIYLTAYPKDWYSPDSSIILMMFYNKTDALYFQGRADARGTDGEVWLPFHERYQVVDFGASGVPENPNAAYLLRDYETDLFDATRYDIREFGMFSVAMPRR